MAPDPQPEPSIVSLPAAHLHGRGSGLLLPALLAVTLSAALLLAQRRIDFTFNEEGFLWYGAVAAAHGAVPLRDFYSYDPGRYYWAAAWTPFAGQGLLGLRLSTAAFGALGLFCGLLAARRAVASRLALAGAGVVVTLWLLPRHKLFEPAITLAAVLAATALIERPTARRHLLAGALVGLAGFIGKNHGLYLGLAFFALIVLLYLRRERPGAAQPGTAAGDPRPGDIAEPAAPAAADSGSQQAAAEGSSAGLPRRLGLWALGIALGAAPLLGMLALVPGFWRSYLDSILFFVHQGRTNFPLPVPWPWRFQYLGVPPWAAAQTLSISLCFLLTAVFFAAGVLAVLCMPARLLRRHALLAAAIVVGSVYTHYAFSRADLAHLAPSIPPLLLGLLALPRALGDAAGALANRSAASRNDRTADLPARPAPPAGDHPTIDDDALPPGAGRWTLRLTAAAVTLLLGFITLSTALPAQPLFRLLSGKPLVACQVAGDTLQLRPPTAGMLDWMRRAAGRIPPEAPIFLAPNLPGLYPFLGRPSPVFDIYPIWPAAGALDRRMLGELRRRNVAWAFLTDTAVDRQEDLAFRHTHPETWAYLQANFHPADGWPSRNQRHCVLLQRNDLATPLPAPAPQGAPAASAPPATPATGAAAAPYR